MQVEGLPVGDGEGIFEAVGGGRRVCFDLFEGWDGIVRGRGGRDWVGGGTYWCVWSR